MPARPEGGRRRTTAHRGHDASRSRLAALLNDEATAHAARHALEGIPFPEAGAALRQALGQVLRSDQARFGRFARLAWRARGGAIARAMLVDNDVSLAAASATALGRIGGDDALAALQEARNRIPTAARPALLEALLRCAEQQLENGQRARATGIYRALFLPTESEPIRVAAYGGMIRSADDGGFDLILSALEGNDTAAGAAALQLAGDLPASRRDQSFCQTAADLFSRSAGRPARAVAGARRSAALPAVLTAARSADPRFVPPPRPPWAPWAMPRASRCWPRRRPRRTPPNSQPPVRPSSPCVAGRITAALTAGPDGPPRPPSRWSWFVR
jgi:hypothetical protein